MQTVDEARAVAALGVDHVGVTPSDSGLPGEVNFTTARAIVDAVRNFAVSVALSVDSDLDAIERMVLAVRPNILHLCGLKNTLPPDAVRTLRERLPNVPIMQAVSITGPEALDVALAYQDVADYLILDSQAPDIAGIGASGMTHDWSISREIVQQVKIPVILAGGLSPENVAEAIRVVQPWGVDSLTHTNRVLPGGGFRKDLDRIRQFVMAAREAWRKI
ncbi:MAG TPA: phosphoribosylanthranilate isomerase [Candidatus Acetothermia bacterium]|nr:phosphoribosylanthranilate isomerase [Candidatus Acetothermia bacterium]HEX32350.1 phosphoribosylanthranilate isomerase [Candidatus Acetothermia bacterium]